SAEAITAHLLRRGLQGIVNDLYQLVEINICCDPVSRFFGRREGAGDAVVSASLADAPKVRET
ncbi:MAG: hypothetical protein RIB49_17945, partial [Rhodospirillales bacterium]